MANIDFNPRAIIRGAHGPRAFNPHWKDPDFVEGDTLSALAKKYNTTIPEMMSHNPQITDPNKIYAGAHYMAPSIEQGMNQPMNQPNINQQNIIQRMAQNAGQAANYLGKDIGNSINRNVIGPIGNTLGNIGNGVSNGMGYLNPFNGLQRKQQQQNEQLARTNKLSQ